RVGVFLSSFYFPCLRPTLRKRGEGENPPPPPPPAWGAGQEPPAVSVICGAGSVARAISVIRAVSGCGANKRADGKSADDAGGDGATVTCFGWLRGGGSCEPNGRGGRGSRGGSGWLIQGSPVARCGPLHLR